METLKFIHFSDTHLGYSDLDKTNSDGTNIREQDFYDAFSAVIDRAIEIKPDFILHSGDIFHRSSPTNKAIVFAYSQLKRVSDAKIPLYIIAGNHDYPKTVFTSPIHKLFDDLPNITVIYDEKYSVIECNDYILHLLPHINDEEVFRKESEKISKVNNGKKEILCMHLSVNSYFKMDELGERILAVDIEERLSDFDYVALGHWHKFQQIKKLGNVYYSGSTERLSEKETGYDKGFIKVELSDKSKVEFEPIELRKYSVIKVQDCFGKDKSLILNEISKKIRPDEINGAIVSVILENVEPSRFYEITNSDFEEMFREALTYSYRKTRYGSDEQVFVEGGTYDLREQISSELDKVFTDSSVKGSAMEIIEEILNEIEEEDENANQ